MLEVFAFCICGAVFLLASWVDFKQRIVPNSAVVLLAIVRLCLVAGSVLNLDGFRVNLWGSSEFFASLIVAIVLCFCMALVAEAISWRTGSMALGFGDVKLVFACTLFCTLEEALLALLIASVAALVLAAVYLVYKNDRTFPFAPALCVGFGVVLAMKML